MSSRWQPGQSGNPAGRPPNSRALTETLKTYGRKTVVDVDGKRRSSNRVLARMVWELLNEGHVTLPSGDVLDVAPTDWLETVKWLYRHIDGPPPAALDITSEGKAIQVVGVGVRPDEL